jgi:ribosomal protein S12 methylthiotransferase accessory factor
MARSRGTLDASPPQPPGVRSLVSPLGVAAYIAPVPMPRGLDRVHAYRTVIGSGRPGTSLPSGRKPITCLGSAVDSPDTARLVAMAEGAERYAAGDFLGEPVIWATAEELKDSALRPCRVARLSEREYAHEACPFRPFSANATIRWVRGVELVSRSEILVPAVMACYQLQDVRPEEKFWPRISTGFAAHTDLTEALVRGICEVAERDAVALLWHHRLELPEYSPAVHSHREGSAATLEEVGYLLDWCSRHWIETYLLDATTDIGLPTVYCLQVAEHDDLAHHVVGCATTRDLLTAAKKALLEAVFCRKLIASRGRCPESPLTFASPIDGGRYMAARERGGAFRFLKHRRQPTSANPAASELPADPAAALNRLIGIFADKGMQVIAVERTTRELADAGLAAVSVLIPDLQPLSVLPFAQFRGHGRLHTAPAEMGFTPLPEEKMNPWPQPFI